MKSLLKVLIFLICIQAYGQNLVPNSSFEHYTSCPNIMGALNKCLNWYNPSFELPDYYNLCGTLPYSIPANMRGAQYPKVGNGYVGIAFGKPNENVNYHYREYLGIKLPTALKAGSQYYIGMYVSLADDSEYSTENLSIFLSTDSISKGSIFRTYLNKKPQITNNLGTISDTTNWVLISDTLLVDSAYNWLYIGNFQPYFNATYIQSNVSGNYPFAYYYIDEVFITPLNTPSISENKPHDVLNQTDDFDNQQVKLIMPNIFTPNNDQVNDFFTPIISKGVISINTLIYNRWGEKLYETDESSINWGGIGVPDGVYFWIVTYTDVFANKKTINGHVTLLR